MAYSRTAGFRPVNTNEWKLVDFKIKASTAISIGTAIAAEITGNDVTGYYTKMGVENATGSDFEGILAQEVASTDADYASTTKTKKAWVPLTPNAKAYFTVGAGTFTATDIPRRVELHSDSKSLAVDTKGKGAVITDYISSTKGMCTFSMPKTETA